MKRKLKEMFGRALSMKAPLAAVIAFGAAMLLGTSAAAKELSYPGPEFTLELLDTRAEKTLEKTSEGMPSAPLAYSKTGWGDVNAPQEPVITVNGYNLDGEYPDDTGVKSYAPAALGSYDFTHKPGNLSATLKWIENTGITVDGTDVGVALSGAGWEYDGEYLTISGAGAKFAFDKTKWNDGQIADFIKDNLISEPANTYYLVEKDGVWTADLIPPTATIVAGSVKQRWPWNGKVDAKVDLTHLIAAKTYALKLRVTVEVEGVAKVYTYPTGVELTGIIEQEGVALTIDTAAASDEGETIPAGRFGAAKLRAVIVTQQE